MLRNWCTNVDAITDAYCHLAIVKRAHKNALHHCPATGDNRFEHVTLDFSVRFECKTNFPQLRHSPVGGMAVLNVNLTVRARTVENFVKKSEPIPQNRDNWLVCGGHWIVSKLIGAHPFQVLAFFTVRNPFPFTAGK